MFNSTPPTSTRLRRPGVGGRRQAIIRESVDLPYVSPVSNYSYGSKVANLPKPPRLSDTKVGLADALSEKTAAVEARLQEEEIVKERERELAVRRRGSREADSNRASIPPPSRAHSVIRDQSVAFEPQNQTVRETAELSTLSGMDTSRSYANEFMIDPAVSNKVREVDIGLDHYDNNGIHQGITRSSLRKRQNHSTVVGNKQSALGITNTSNSSDDESVGVFEFNEDCEKSTSKPMGPDARSDSTNRAYLENDSHGNRLVSADRQKQWLAYISKENPRKAYDRGFRRSHRAAMDVLPPSNPTDLPPEFWTAPFDAIFYHMYIYLYRLRPFQWFLGTVLTTVVIYVVLVNINPDTYAKFVLGKADQIIPSGDIPTDWNALKERVVVLEKKLGAKLSNTSDEDRLKSSTLSTLKISQNMIQENISSLYNQLDVIKKTSLQMSNDIDNITRWTSLAKTDLQTILPLRQMIIIKDNLPTFTDEFMKVLNDSIENRFSLDGSAWQRFLKDNNERLATLPIRHESKDNDETEVVMSRESIIKLMGVKFDQFMEDCRRDLKSQDSHSRPAYQVKDALSSIYKSKLEALTELRNLITTIQSSEGKLLISDTLPDYAGQMGGGRIWPYLTSASYQHERPEGHIIGWLVGKIGGRLRHTTPPAVAIRPSQDVGDCWPFPAQAPGIIAIRLREEIRPTHVTIEHMDRSRLVEEGSVPRAVEFWVSIINETQRDIIEQSSLLISNATGTETRESRQIHPNGYYDFVKLSSFEYNIGSSSSQTFELPPQVRDAHFKTALVAFRITSNYGNNNYTCLYRVKVHGRSGSTVSTETLTNNKEDSTNSALSPAKLSKRWSFW